MSEKKPLKSGETSAHETSEADDFDVSLIESNLRRTPQERIRVHNGFLRTVSGLREAVERYNARR